MERTATAVWNGSLKEGHGTISAQSGILSDAPYSFVTRFENGKGTNPEELIAAAHAGCFTMALSAQLGTMNVTPDRLRTVATRHARKARCRMDDFEDSSGRNRSHSRYFAGCI